MFEAIKKLNENAGSLAIGLAVVGLLLNNTWQISEARQALSADISRVEVKLSRDIHEGRLETNTEISGLKERVGALEASVRGPAPQESTHTNASAEPSTAREPSPETSGQPRTSARP